MLEIHLSDPETERFVREVVNDFTKLDIVLYLSRDDYECRSMEDISQYVGRDAADIRRALDDLIMTGLVVPMQMDERSLYCLSRDRIMKDRIDGLFGLYENVTERLKIVSILIQTSSEQAGVGG